ncbi:lamin tail domain-containing protein [Streptosporangium sp. NPDC050855]|uniref:lamin tail domain-containing protein n=1 Tax=Streptosporangium sp. NPDC050855 TaxID=3366194 RepID=UPI00379AACBF
MSAALALALVPVAPAQAAAVPAIQIVRIHYNSPGSPDNGANLSLNGEWIQLKNTTRRAINLRGWTLRDKTNRSDHVYTFSPFVLSTGKTVTVRTGRGSNTAANRYWGRGGQGTFSYIWNQTSDTGYVHNSTGKLVDSCAYNSSRQEWVDCR